MPVNVNTVVFAIKAGVRLYRAGEAVLVQNTAARALPLPLPIGETSDEAGAEAWLKTNPEAGKLAGQPEFARLASLRGTSRSNWSDADTEYVTAIFNNWFEDKNREAGYVSAAGMTLAETAAYIQVRQWSVSEDSGHSTALQRIAGTMVNIAVDYFVQTPGSLNLEQAEGRALKGFLEAIDDTDFAGGPVESIAGDLLVGILEAVRLEPDLIGKGDTTRRFVKGITASLGKSTNQFLDNLHLLSGDERERRQAWLQMLSHAMVRGAAQVALSDPETILGVREEEAPVIEEVAGSIAGLLLGGDESRRLQFEKVFSGAGLETVTRSALKAVSENPDVLGIDQRGLERLLVDIADELEQYDDLFTRDLGPELIRLVLEKSGRNLQLLVGGDADNPRRNLLILASSELLANVSEASWTGGTWHPRLTRGQLLEVAEVVFDEVLDNPYWLRKLQSVGAAGDTPLGVAVEAVVTSLKNTELGDRLASDTVVAAIRAGVGAAALNIELLKKLPDAAAGDARTALTAALDAIFDGIFAGGSGTATRWRQAGNAVLQLTIEVVMESLATVAVKEGLQSAQIDSIQAEVRHWVDAIIAGADPEQLILEALAEIE